MKAHEVCQKAAELVSNDRAKTHGNKLENHQNIANLWNQYLSAKFLGCNVELSATDIAILMILLKVARTTTGTFNIDDFIDIAGYAGCAAEIEQSEGL